MKKINLFILLVLFLSACSTPDVENPSEQLFTVGVRTFYKAFLDSSDRTIIDFERNDGGSSL